MGEGSHKRKERYGNPFKECVDLDGIRALQEELNKKGHKENLFLSQVVSPGQYFFAGGGATFRSSPHCGEIDGVGVAVEESLDVDSAFARRRILLEPKVLVPVTARIAVPSTLHVVYALIQL